MTEKHHGHSHAPSNYNRAFAVGITLNLAFVAIEAYAGLKVNSLALLADAAHNLSDVAGLLLAWGGFLAGRLRPDARHTYGWRRASILAAFINAVLLLVAMGSLAWEAMERLNTPMSTEGWTIIWVAAAGIGVNTATALMFMQGRTKDLNIRGAFMHMAADALVSAGVVLGGALYLWQRWTWIDPVMSLAIALLIVVGTAGLFKQSLHLLFDGVPQEIDLTEVRECLLGLPGVADVHDLHVWALGTSHIALTAHLVIDPGVADNSRLLAQAVRELHDRFDIEHATLQTELASYALQCSQHEADHV